MCLYSTFLSENVLGHGRGDEGGGPAVGFPQQEVGGRQLGGERQAGQGVHDQVHPQHLHRLQFDTLISILEYITIITRAKCMHSGSSFHYFLLHVITN